MAKPYRRRKGKNGPYVGNYRVSINGRDINLETKDAQEAHARARLAAKGKWPVIPAAVSAAVDALDPGRTQDPEPSHLAGDAEGEGGGTPHAVPPATHVPPPPEPSSHETPPPLNDAAAAAAAEVSGGVGVDPEVQAEQENGVNVELKAVMAELGGGASGADLLDGLCDGGAAFLLWAEAKAMQLGVNWTLKRRRSPLRIVLEQPEQSSIMRKALRVGLKGAMVTYFPDFAQQLTPGWAIAIGLVGGAGVSVMNGKFIDTKNGKETSVGDVIAQAQAEATAAAEPAPEASPPASA